jgi:single-stranded-DNA-specific exonuclease
MSGEKWTRSAARWIAPAPAQDAIGRLAEALGLHRLTAAVLVNRGFSDPPAVREFLSPHLEALHDPLQMRDMERATERLFAAIDKREPILLYGDYDVDGTTSIVVLKKALEILGADVRFHVPHRLTEGYGMRTEIIEQATRDGVRLVVSVDTGIRAGEVVRYARQLGVDVIVTDHHLADAELPPALAVLNPNRSDCPYPNKHLCGAGVTLKLVQSLLASSALPDSRKAMLLDSFLKPVAIATVADIVPLLGENRVIVRRGLSGLKHVRNVGLKCLLSVAGFEEGESPSAHQVAFRLAPRINAAGRMATARDVIELFLTDRLDRAQQLSQQLDALNRERQQAEAEIVEAILRQCETITMDVLGAAMVFAGSGWHPGVLGIVASRLVERFCRPVFVLSDTQTRDVGANEEPCLAGSGRSIPAFHLLEALESMAELFRKFGGHRQAAGLTLPASRLDEFRKRFAAFAGQKLTEDDLRPHYLVDAVASFPEISENSVREILELGPFGFGHPAPIFHATDVEVAAPPRDLKDGKHFSVPLKHQGRLLFSKAWNFGHRAELFIPGSRIDILFQIEDDPASRKRGYGSWCISLKDARPAQENHAF